MSDKKISRKSIITYFLSVLNQRNYTIVPKNIEDIKYQSDICLICNQNEILQNRISQKNISDLVKQLENKKSKEQKLNGQKQNNQNITNLETISVSLYPVSIETCIENSYKESVHIGLFSIPCLINTKTYEITINGEKDNRIIPTCICSPRSLGYLSLNVKEGKQSVPYKVNCSVADYIDTIKNDYEEAFIGSKWGDTTITDKSGSIYNLDWCWRVVYEEEISVLAKANIVRFLKELLKNNDELPLLDTIFGCKGVIGNVCTPSTLTKYHKGQMDNKYPLGASQRETLQNFGKIQDGDVLAVPGPPGTGKTTLLLSIVADVLVKSVLYGKPQDLPFEEGCGYKDKEEFLKYSKRAPIILFTSATNQAITNIIDSFGKALKPLNLNDCKSDTRFISYKCNKGNMLPVPLATFLPSDVWKQNNEGKKSYFIDDNYNEILSSYKSDDEEKVFLNNINKAYHLNVKSIVEAKKKLYNLLEKKNKELEFQILKLDSSNGFLSSLEKLFVHKEILLKDSSKDVREKYQSLDMSLRYECFWLAVHYYEASWMERIRNKNRISKIKKDNYEIRALLTPGIVSTMHRLPSALNENYKYFYNWADLLVIDEAGQISPELGLFSFSFAKRAIVVGDQLQIPPVWSIEEPEDKVIWESIVGNINDNYIYDYLSCSKSSVMRAAEKYSRFTNLQLKEHRRCQEPIISYCNELCYDNKLECYTKDIDRDIDKNPLMAYYHVVGETKTVNGSKVNIAEAEKIAEWLRVNYDLIEKFYDTYKPDDKDTDKVIVITPFKEQKKVLQLTISKVLKKKIRVGTVHAFQGAESFVVIYSTVYQSDPYFIVNSKELMNVAVSRAKEHFFVFGNKKCMEGSNNKVAKLLIEKCTEKVPEVWIDSSSRS